jgi:RNA polymerase sigma-70 factor (ECF subfamily)
MTELVRQIRKKDKKAIAALYNSYGKKLYGFAIAKWNVNEDEAWELIYKTLYKVIDVIDKYTFESESKFNGFIFQIFINNLRNQYNEKKSKQLEMVDMKTIEYTLQEKESAEEEQQPSNNPYMNCLKKILEQFEDWKKILLLMKAQNYSYEDISNYVNKPSEQLKVYYMRAKKILTEKVNECVNNV